MIIRPLKELLRGWKPEKTGSEVIVEVVRRLQAVEEEIKTLPPDWPARKRLRIILDGGKP